MGEFTVTEEFAPPTGLTPCLYFDAMKDEFYPNGAWVCTTDTGPDDVYDSFYAATPNDAYALWRADNSGEGE